MTPSPQQEAVFQNVREGEGHTVVRARAGTGKTTTIITALSYLPENVQRDTLMVAFNKEIATTLEKRAPSRVTVQTLHSYGLRQLSSALANRPKIEQYKTSDIVAELVKDRDLRGVVSKAVSAAKSNLVPHDNLIALAKLLDDVPLPEGQAPESLAPVVGKALCNCADDQSRVDFDDMIWMPNVFDIPTTKYRRVFVDETQDLNPAQLALALRAGHKNGRILAVGDDRQAIYGFRGAGKDSLGDVVRGLDAKVLPLTVTYRCAKAIVREAARYVQDFGCPFDAPEGLVKETGESEMLAKVGPGDFILSRTNAPLITLAFAFVKQGIKVTIAGKDIGANLKSIVVRSRASDPEGLIAYIQRWCTKEVARLEKLNRDASSVLDITDCVINLTEGCDTISAVTARIELLFADKGEATEGRIVLSSTHKAKGLERERVWLLRNTYMRRRGDDEGSIPTEEINLYYVAVTRAKRELYLVY